MPLMKTQTLRNFNRHTQFVKLRERNGVTASDGNMLLSAAGDDSMLHARVSENLSSLSGAHGSRVGA